MINAALALARTYLLQKRGVRLEEAVGIVVAHKVTEMECRQLLMTEQTKAIEQLAGRNFNPQPDLCFNEVCESLWSFWVTIVAGQTAMSQTFQCIIDVRCCANKWSMAGFRHLVWSSRMRDCTFHLLPMPYLPRCSATDFFKTLLYLKWNAWSKEETWEAWASEIFYRSTKMPIYSRAQLYDMIGGWVFAPAESTQHELGIRAADSRYPWAPAPAQRTARESHDDDPAGAAIDAREEGAADPLDTNPTKEEEETAYHIRFGPYGDLGKSLMKGALELPKCVLVFLEMTT
jgi:hypothetical protein